jgi:hypothetical protein
MWFHIFNFSLVHLAGKSLQSPAIRAILVKWAEV